MGKVREKLNAFYNRIVGEQATPEYIARGWAIGMFWGCICPFGLQLIFSIPTSFLLKGSKIGATVGTFITNHFTVFLIYPLQTYAGCLITGKKISYAAIKTAMVGRHNVEKLRRPGGNRHRPRHRILRGRRGICGRNDPSRLLCGKGNVVRYRRKHG